MKIRGVLLDLDGTVYHGTKEVPGAADFVRYLRENEVACLFLTNRSTRTAEQICQQLRTHAIPCNVSDILTSGQAAAQMLRGQRIYVIGEEGLSEELRREGVSLTQERPQAVVVGLDRGFTYEKLATACRLIREGARFVATNTDAVMNVENGLIPGAGSLVAAIATGSGVSPEVIGKPEPTLIRMGMHRLGLRPEETVVIGDNLATDIVAASRASVRSVLLLTGVSSRSDLATASLKPTWIAEAYPALHRLFYELLGTSE